MFTVIYKFNVKNGMNQEFIEGWKGLTELIFEYEGSLGSRLHSVHNDLYVAYAQWPNKSTWENSGSKLPKAADLFRDKMKNSCEQIETEYEMDVVCDLLAQ